MARPRLIIAFLLLAAVRIALSPTADGWVVIDQNGVVAGDQALNFQQAAPGQLRFGLPGPASRLSEFAPNLATSRVRRTLMQFDALTSDGAWDEAIDVVEQLQAEHGRELIATMQEESTSEEESAQSKRYEPVAARCQRLLASLPPDGLEVYRRRSEGAAREWLREGLQRLDRERLARVLQEAFPSQHTAEALLALGDLALERGDTASARWHWRRLHPLLWGPLGEPIGVTVADIAPSVSDQRLARAWTESERPEDLPLCQGADVPLPSLLARLVIASLQEEDTPRAAAELRLLRALEPEATGRLAGREQTLVPALESMIEAQRGLLEQPDEAPLPTGLRWAWIDPVSHTGASMPLNTNALVARQNQLRVQQLLAAQQRRAGAPFFRSNALKLNHLNAPLPHFADGSVLFVDRGVLKRFDAATADPIATRLPDQPKPTQSADSTRILDPPRVVAQAAGNGQMVIEQKQIVNGRVVINRRVVGGANARGLNAQQLQRLQTARPSGPLLLDASVVVHDGVLYTQYLRPRSVATVNNHRTMVPGSVKLIGVDLRRDDKLVFEITQQQAAGEDGLNFAGPPALDGKRLYQVLKTTGAQSRLAVACFDSRTGERQWLTEVGSGQAPQGDSAPRLTVAGDSLYLATALGAVVAFDKQQGAIRWLATYPRTARGQQPGDRVGCLVMSDRVIVAPIDSSQLFALSTADGRTLWSVEREDPAAALLGGNKQGVALGGNRLASYDPLTGRRQFLWPETDRSGIRGMGSGTVAGGEVLWPTRDTLYGFRLKNGAPSRPPIDLTPISTGGARVVRSGDRVLVSGSKAVSVLSASGSAAGEPKEPESPPPRLISGLSAPAAPTASL